MTKILQTIQLAAKSGHDGICELFLGNIRDKHPKNKHGMAPLHLSVLEGHLNVCQLIVNKVEDKNPKTHRGGFTPLAGWNLPIIDLLEPYHMVNESVGARRANSSDTFWFKRRKT